MRHPCGSTPYFSARHAYCFGLPRSTTFAWLRTDVYPVAAGHSIQRTRRCSIGSRGANITSRTHRRLRLQPLSASHAPSSPVTASHRLLHAPSSPVIVSRRLHAPSSPAHTDTLSLHLSISVDTRLLRLDTRHIFLSARHAPS